MVHWASAAAIFIGWYLASMTPSSLPTNMASMMDGTSTTSETRAVRPNASTELPRRRCQAETASMTSAPVTAEASSTWVYPHRNTGLVKTATMLFSCGCPVVELICVADRMLHPGVGGHDEGGRQGAAHGHQPDAGQMDPFGQPVPAEDPQPQEGRLQEEGGQALPWPAGPRTRRRRSGSRPTSSCRTRTPAPARSPPRWPR